MSWFILLFSNKTAYKNYNHVNVSRDITYHNDLVLWTCKINNTIKN